MYLTYSEGYRPGLLNRPGGSPARTNTIDYTVPFELQTDELTNHEFGWKMDLLDGSLRFNGTLFYSDIENLQTTILDPNISNLFFSDNAADAQVIGFEGDFQWALTDNLFVAGGFSMLDSEITEVLTPTGDVREGDSLAFAPNHQANLQVRYEWDMSGLRAHVMPHMSMSDEMNSDIIRPNSDRVDSWMMYGLTAGVTADTWNAELFIDNITNEQAELARNFVNDRQRVNYARPLTAGVRFSFGF